MLNTRTSLLILLTLAFTATNAGQESDSRLVQTSNPVERGLAETDFPRVKEVAPGVYTFEALTGPEDDRYTTNSMFVVTTDGVLVADGQGNLLDTSRLIAEIRNITDRPISHVVICSDHGDHTNGNGAFPQDAEFIAHENSVAALTEAAGNGGTMPTTIIGNRLDLTLGNREIQILFLGRAHTGGDLLVYLPDQSVLFASEIFLNHMFSGYRTAFAAEWLETMRRAEEIGADILIPGHGFVDDPEALRGEWVEYRNHLQVVLDEVTRLYQQGVSVDDAIHQADFGIYANWSGAAFQGPIGIRRIYAELDGARR